MNRLPHHFVLARYGRVECEIATVSVNLSIAEVPGIVTVTVIVVEVALGSLGPTNVRQNGTFVPADWLKFRTAACGVWLHWATLAMPGSTVTWKASVEVTVKFWFGAVGVVPGTVAGMSFRVVLELIAIA